jgi:CxxC motif-containing protein (DUF1111 family)
MRSGWPLILAFTLVAAPVQARRGGPMPGLSAAELVAFKEGFLAFRSQVFPQQGLGPAFNATQCYLCHSNPLGGHSEKTVVRFGRDAGGAFDPLTSVGGSFLQSKGVASGCAEVLPPGADVVVRRNATSALGFGLVEAIPDQQIIDRAAAELAEQPARAGRVHMVTGVADGLPHVGRFGWKAQRALLIDVVGESMLNEMGFTNALFPADVAPNGDPALLARCDTAPDPEDVTDVLNKLTRLVRYLAPPPPHKKMTDVLLLGEQLFHAIGCGFCHYDGYTAVSPHPAIDGQRVPLYSDLLLHDVGTGDGIEDGDARGNEFRTAPLWSLRGGHPYLHDGRARTVADAIVAHGGQALAARNAYLALSVFDQKAILRFLRR